MTVRVLPCTSDLICCIGLTRAVTLKLAALSRQELYMAASQYLSNRTASSWLIILNRKFLQEREGKREDGNALVNLALSQRAQAEQDLLDHFVTALHIHSRTLEEQLVGDSTQYNELKQRCAALSPPLPKSAHWLSFDAGLVGRQAGIVSEPGAQSVVEV